MADFAPGKTLFILLSFEGPDLYSQAGGLGVRMAGLSRALAEAGFETHLFFIGDPNLPGESVELNGRLVYHRWCQWISRWHPGGVYDGEEGKKLDFEKSAPEWISENIFPRAPEQIVVMGEDWQTAAAIVSLSQLAKTSRSSQNILFLWNANNIFGFNRIDWPVLQKHAYLTTVSRYMKHLMGPLRPLVIPNGIPDRWFEPVNSSLKSELRRAARTDFLLAKVGRFDPSKEWLMAVQSLAQLKQRGLRPKLILRGDRAAHGSEVRALARNLNLKIHPVALPNNPLDEDFLEAVRAAPPQADILDLRFFASEGTLRLVYSSADAVLANSGHEPFGLVGLEVMASSGLAVTGSTGEDYAQSFQNSIVLDTRDPRELTSSLLWLSDRPGLADRIKKAGHESAKAFRWPNILEALHRKLLYLGQDPSGLSREPLLHAKNPGHSETGRRGARPHRKNHHAD